MPRVNGGKIKPINTYFTTLFLWNQITRVDISRRVQRQPFTPIDKSRGTLVGGLTWLRKKVADGAAYAANP